MEAIKTWGLWRKCGRSRPCGDTRRETLTCLFFFLENLATFELKTIIIISNYHVQVIELLNRAAKSSKLKF